MKEITSSHDDMDKRLAIFFGLGAFIMSAMVGIIRGYTLEGFLLQGVVVLAVACVGGYVFGAWLRGALSAAAPKEELPPNVERRKADASSLAEGSIVMPEPETEAVIAEEPKEATGSVVNYTLPELYPTDLLSPPPPPPMSAPSNAEPQDSMDLPPPPVPAGLK